MSIEPPPFQEAERCDVCKCSFSTFRRRHHCRCCGRTFCHEHSSNQMALPHIGIYMPVRVCADCFNGSSQSKNDDNRLNGVDDATDSISKLNIDAYLDSKTAPTLGDQPVLGASDCKCGMPLCICEAPSPSTKAHLVQKENTSTFTHQLNPKEKKTDTNRKNRGSTSNRKLCSVFNPSQMIKSTSDDIQIDYESNEEGLREAIKNGDIGAVKKLLNEGVNANYRDKQGLYLLHLAAVFNHADIVFALLESGASLDSKNAQGETPLDCAPATLQYKMRKWMEESKQ